MKAESRFWSKVSLTPDCWIWTAAKAGKGYGVFWFDGKQRYAHRVVWRFAHGPIPDGLQVCHICDNPPCVRPSHLFLGTQSDNLLDAFSKGRMTNPQFSGEENGNSKLIAQDILDIRKLKSQGYTIYEIAPRFGIHPSNVALIAQGKTWRHLLPEEV